MQRNTIVVIGGGLIGQQWGMVFAAGKRNVIIYDISSEQIEVAKRMMKVKLENYIKENISRSEEDSEIQLGRIKYSSILDELPKNAEFVMECVPEDRDLKAKIFSMLDSHFDEETIRMSSSSYIPISKFTNNLKNRHKCIIAHPVSPPYFLRFVEIVPAPYTDKDTIDKVKILMEQVGQVPIGLKREIEGFALNRIQAAVYNSIFNLLKNDIVEVSDVDKIFTDGLAPRWTFFGPMVVLALNGPGVENYFSKYLPSFDTVNNDQGYPPQHDCETIAIIINEMKGCDSEMLSKIYESRDLYLGQVLKIKTQSEDK